MNQDFNPFFAKANEAWNSLAEFRESRARAKRYLYGDQWSDIIPVDGRNISEHQYIREQGQVPLKNNLIRRLVRNVLGVYRNNFNIPALKKSDFPNLDIDLRGLKLKVAANARRNALRELYPRLMEEFLLSGLAAVRKYPGVMPDGEKGVMTVPVTPDNFFFLSSGNDPRGWNVDLVGEHHIVPLDDICSKFGKTASDFRRIMDIFTASCTDLSRCRVTEVWHRATRRIVAVHDRGRAMLRMIPLENVPDTSDVWKSDCRVISRQTWRQSFFSPDGRLIWSRESSLPSGGHPYVFKCYPFLDGEIHSYVDDVIDQQRFVNRLVTMYDWIMKSSAKGVLLFPQNAIPRGKSIADVAREWSSFNGVITYRPEPGVPLPQQVSGNAANIGIAELLKIQMQLLEDISGVSPTLQGKIETHATSGSLFEQQSKAAVSSLLDITETFDEFVRASTVMDAKLLLTP